MAVFKVNVAKREACQAYMDYWNNTAKVTKTRKAVDAVISPVAPYPAARRGASEYLGYTSWVSVLDYTSLAVPLGTVDEKLDKVPSGFVPRDDLEKSIWESCKSSPSNDDSSPSGCLGADHRYATQTTRKSTMELRSEFSLLGGDFRKRKCWPLERLLKKH